MKALILKQAELEGKPPLKANKHLPNCDENAPLTGSDVKGRFVSGRLTGYGKAEYVSKTQGVRGDCYTGMFRDGKRSGHGEMIFNQFSEIIMDYQPAKYVGRWRFNKRNGHGVMTWPDGSKYEGEWSNDCRVQGKLFMPQDHNEYEGSFKDDKFEGIGKITYTREGITFEGLFEAGLASNIGKIVNQATK